MSSSGRTKRAVRLGVDDQPRADPSADTPCRGGSILDITPPARDDLVERLDALARKHGVPGAAAGVLVGDEMTVCATGVTRDDAEGVPITDDTLFLVGSITKVWTATLVMQLVDEGRVGLDDRVNSHLDPPLQLADQGVADTVTIRQLLTHTGGFYGDREDPPERGDDGLLRAIASYADLPQLHRPGQLFSYCNAGYNVVGRLVECLSGSNWDDALRERVLLPLGLQRTSTLPEQAMVHPVAIGHDLDLAEKKQTPVTVWCDSRAAGPCGGTLAMRAADLLAFAKMHLRDGQGPDGTRVLSPQSARLMREPQVAMNDPVMGLAWGLGWEIGRVDEPVVVGHGGNTNGQMALLFRVPERSVAITNGDATARSTTRCPPTRPPVPNRAPHPAGRPTRCRTSAARRRARPGARTQSPARWTREKGAGDGR